MKKIHIIFFTVFILYSCNNKYCDIEKTNSIAFKNLNNFIEDKDLNTDKLDLSISNFNKVLNCDSTNTYALQYVVLAHLYKKDFSKALSINKKAIINGNLLPFFIAQRGTIYELSGNKDSSIYYFNKALNIQIDMEKKFQDSLEIKIQIVNLLDKIGKKDLAKERIEKYIKANPENDILKSIQLMYKD
ncbi:hypothetical protein MTsPCn5_16500 [Croceitalea sp. MTPC5]|uniref:tetratricopeptide repeat protein n=1 Tax=Croceitalea sp. MTPC5 TaxID=3056565 RepID=UPI002B39A258|nr:hypothetical protein MTsPCn5_16500 [Croceitalea sp. MTPC5]